MQATWEVAVGVVQGSAGRKVGTDGVPGRCAEALPEDADQQIALDDPQPPALSRALTLLTRRRLERGAFTSTADLEAAILAYIAETNAHPKPFVWTRTADDILAGVARFCQRTSNSGH